MNELGIYLHVPWCRRRCPYCDFYFVVGKPKGGYVEAIMAEWQARKDYWQKMRGVSLYFGGGTPSLLSSIDIQRLRSYFEDQGLLYKDAEITLEANPEDLDQLYIENLAKSGVNRISLGIQSFDNKILKLLGRKHDESLAKKSLEDLLAAGLKNISVDLIIGVASESVEKIYDDLEYLASKKIPHISAYLLTIEQKTKFYRDIISKKMPDLDDDQQADIFSGLQLSLTKLGYIQYDISSYALDAKFSRHNQIYWGMGSYIGLGPGAHSMRLKSDGGRERSQNQADLAAWLKDPTKKHSGGLELLSKTEALLESLAFGLRNMHKGINPTELAKIHKTEIPAHFFSSTKKMIEFGWLEHKAGIYRLTSAGALFADAIMRDILCS